MRPVHEMDHERPREELTGVRVPRELQVEAGLLRERRDARVVSEQQPVRVAGIGGRREIRPWARFGIDQPCGGVDHAADDERIPAPELERFDRQLRYFSDVGTDGITPSECQERLREAKVAVLGTGVNPGFTMDALPIALTAVCERVTSIEVLRVQDARVRRLPFQQKIGAGLTKEQFGQRVAGGTVRHVGFTESIQMIADAMGWKLDRVTDEIEPRMADADVASDLLSVRAGQVCGLIQRGTGYVNGEPRIRLRLEAYLGAPDSYESVLIEGSPRIHSRIAGGVHGDIATASMAVNSIPAVMAAQPGFRTMRDMRLPSFYGG